MPVYMSTVDAAEPMLPLEPKLLSASAVLRVAPLFVNTWLAPTETPPLKVESPPTVSVLEPDTVTFWFKLIPAVAFVVPTLRVVVPDGVSSSGVKRLVAAIPVPPTLKLAPV